MTSHPCMVIVMVYRAARMTDLEEHDLFPVSTVAGTWCTTKHFTITLSSAEAKNVTLSHVSHAIKSEQVNTIY